MARGYPDWSEQEVPRRTIPTTSGLAESSQVIFYDNFNDPALAWITSGSTFALCHVRTEYTYAGGGSLFFYIPAGEDKFSTARRRFPRVINDRYILDLRYEFFNDTGSRFDAQVYVGSDSGTYSAGIRIDQDDEKIYYRSGHSTWTEIIGSDISHQLSSFVYNRLTFAFDASTGKWLYTIHNDSKYDMSSISMYQNTWDSDKFGEVYLVCQSTYNGAQIMYVDEVILSELPL